MKQTGMVGVARVLRVHLPVVRQHFNEAADDFDSAAAKDPVEPSQNLWSNEVFDGRRLVGERAEHEAVDEVRPVIEFTRELMAAHLECQVPLLPTFPGRVAA